MALVSRKLRATITLAAISGQAPLKPFPNSGGADTVIIENLRMSAEIMNAGGASMGELHLTIYGLSRSTMNRLSTIGLKLNELPKNAIVLEAGDDQSGMSTVFVGFAQSCLADFNASPDVAFHILGFTLAPQSVESAEASSFPGYADVATILSGLATRMGLKFENNGVSGSLSNSYFSGSYKQQAQDCVEHAGISWNAGEGGVLAIWPKFGSRGGAVPLVSPQTGLIGYPTFSAMGVDCRTLFNPSIGFGGKIKLQTSLENASGIYAVQGLHHQLACEMPDGPWFSTLNCYTPSTRAPSG